MNSIPSGHHFILTHWVYSPEKVIALCRAEQDLNIEKLRQEFIKQLDGGFSDEKFVSWLINSEYATKIDFFEFHISDFGCVGDEMHIRKITEIAQLHD